MDDDIELPAEVRQLLLEAETEEPHQKIPDLTATILSQPYELDDKWIFPEPIKLGTRCIIHSIDENCDECKTVRCSTHSWTEDCQQCRAIAPAIFPRQKHGTSIIMQSAVEIYDHHIQKIYDYFEKAEQDISKLVDDTETDIDPEEFNIPRALQGLADVCDRYRRNMNEYIDPSIFPKKRQMRMMQHKQESFLRDGFKKQVILIEQHIRALIFQGKFPEKMFGQYRKFIRESLLNTNTETALYAGMNLVLCAEIVMPAAEQITPIKRITEAIPSGI